MLIGDARVSTQDQTIDLATISDLSDQGIGFKTLQKNMDTTYRVQNLL
jgi:hypothetical protein